VPIVVVRSMASAYVFESLGIMRVGPLNFHLSTLIIPAMIRDFERTRLY